MKTVGTVVGNVFAEISVSAGVTYASWGGEDPRVDEYVTVTLANETLARAAGTMTNTGSSWEDGRGGIPATRSPDRLSETAILEISDAVRDGLDTDVPLTDSSVSDAESDREREKLEEMRHLAGTLEERARILREDIARREKT